MSGLGRGERSGALAALLLAAFSAPTWGQSFPCLLEPSAVVNASTAVEGILETVAVEKGDAVSAGEVVAQLDASVEEALVEQARARMEMSASLRAREEELRLAQLRHGRAKELSAKNYVAPDELDELRSALVVAELRLLEEKDNRRLAELELQRVQAQYELRFIKSPITGVVVERFLGAGEFAQAQPIVKLAQLNPVNVEVVLPSSHFGRILKGATARVRTLGVEGITFEATVAVVERVVDAASDTFGVRLQVDNHDHSIPVGMECTAEFLPHQQTGESASSPVPEGGV